MFSNNFVWDDHTFITGWETTRKIENIPYFFAGDYPHEGKYRPIKGVIHTLNYELWGYNLFWYHLQALVIHTLVSLVLFLIIRKLTNGQCFVPLLSTLLFATHPIHVEAIAFLTSSTDVYGVFFALLSFYYYIQSYNRPFYLSLSIVFYTLGIFTYETVLILPILMLTYRLLFYKLNKPKATNVLLSLLSYLYPLGVYALLRTIFSPLTRPFPMDSYLLSWLTSLKAFLKYFEVLLLPTKLSINHYVDKGLLSFHETDLNKSVFLNQGLDDSRLIIAFILLVTLIIVSVLLVKKNSVLVFGIIWWIIFLIPVLGFLPLSNFMSERYAYLSSAGYCLSVALIFQGILIYKKGFTTTGVVITILLLLFTYIDISWNRIGNWQSDIALWSREVEYAPESALAHQNLGSGYYRIGDYNKALAELKIASTLNRNNNNRIFTDIGQLYWHVGEFKKGGRYLLLGEANN